VLFKEIKEIEVVVQLVKLRATFKSNFDAYFLERCHDGWNTCTQQCATQNTGKSALFPSVEYFEVLARVCPTGSVARVGMTGAGFPRCLFCWRLWSNGERLYRLVCQEILDPLRAPRREKQPSQVSAEKSCFTVRRFAVPRVDLTWLFCTIHAAPSLFQLNAG